MSTRQVCPVCRLQLTPDEIVCHQLINTSVSRRWRVFKRTSSSKLHILRTWRLSSSNRRSKFDRTKIKPSKQRFFTVPFTFYFLPICLHHQQLQFLRVHISAFNGFSWFALTGSDVTRTQKNKCFLVSQQVFWMCCLWSTAVISAPWDSTSCQQVDYHPNPDGAATTRKHDRRFWVNCPFMRLLIIFGTFCFSES